MKTRIYLPLNSTCNFNCSYCVANCNNNQNFTIYPQRADHYKNNIYMNFVNYHFNEDDIISFSGGEPTDVTNKDLVLHYLKNTKLKCDLLSNLSNPSFIYQIRKHCRYIYCTYHRGQITEGQFLKNLEFLLSKNIKNIIVKEILFPNIIDKQLEFRKLITEKYKLEFEFEKFKPYKEGFYTNEQKSLLKMKNVTVGTTLNFCQCESEYDSIMVKFNGDITKCWYMHEPIANIRDKFPIKLNTYIKENYKIKDGKLERELIYETSNEDLFENIGDMKILK